MAKEHIDTTGSTISIDGTLIDGVSPDSIPFPKPTRDTKDVTMMKDTVKRKGLKILDPGSASFSGLAIPGDAGQILLQEASNDGKEHTIQITIPEAALTYEYQTYVATDYPSVEDENSLFFNVDLEVTGGFIRSATFAGITSIEGAGAGIAYSPTAASTALPATAEYVIFKEATGVTSDTVKVTAASSSYIGISYDGGKNWTKLTSGTASSIPAAAYPAAGGLSVALIKVMENNKATRFVKLLVARA